MGVTDSGGQSREDRSREILRQVWLRNRSTTMERLAVVAAALTSLAAGELDAERCDAGLSEAHKLRGILGTYGFTEGSELATEAEEMFQGGGETAGAGELAVRLAHYARSLPDT